MRFFHAVLLAVLVLALGVQLYMPVVKVAAAGAQMGPQGGAMAQATAMLPCHGDTAETMADSGKDAAQNGGMAKGGMQHNGPSSCMVACCVAVLPAIRFPEPVYGRGALYVSGVAELVSLISLPGLEPPQA